MPSSHSSRSPSPTLISFDDASLGGSEPAEPVVGRRTGFEGWVSEYGDSLGGGAGEGGDVEGEQLAWRMKELQFQSGRYDQAEASFDSHFPSTGLGAPLQHGATEARFLLGLEEGTAELGTTASIEDWRDGLSHVPRHRSGSLSVMSPDASRPPLSLILPTGDQQPQHYHDGTTPLAHPFSASIVSASVEGFTMFHSDPVDPASLPLPDAPDDYCFPDVRGKASFSRSPPSALLAKIDTSVDTLTLTPHAPHLSATRLSPSPPSSFSAITPSFSLSPAEDPLTTPPAPFTPSKVFRLASLSDVCLTSDGASGHEALAEMLQKERVRVEQIEREVAYLREMQAEKVNSSEKKLETVLSSQGIDTSTTPILILPPSLASLTACPRCSRPLNSPSDPSYYPAGNPFLRSDLRTPQSAKRDS
ncbi:hypothetical protein JCM11641_001709 [Rhodosporidiobolus odoratus]